MLFNFNQVSEPSAWQHKALTEIKVENANNYYSEIFEVSSSK